MRKKLQVGKPVNIANIQGATIPDGVARIGPLRFESNGTLTFSMHYFLNEADADANKRPITTSEHNMVIPNLENQIITFIKTQPEFDAATDV